MYRCINVFINNLILISILLFSLDATSFSLFNSGKLRLGGNEGDRTVLQKHEHGALWNGMHIYHTGMSESCYSFSFYFGTVLIIWRLLSYSHQFMWNGCYIILL